jgi:hypothetical protein
MRSGPVIGVDQSVAKNLKTWPRGDRDAENRGGATSAAKKNRKLVRLEVPFAIFAVPAGKMKTCAKAAKEPRTLRI